MKYNKAPEERDRTAISTGSFESATYAVISRHFPVRERAMLYVLAAFFVFIFVFICFFKLDRVVNAQGRIVPVGGALTVQPLEKAIITRVMVSVGDVVHKNQVLATCDPTFVHADLSASQDKVASLDAQKRMWEALEKGHAFVPDPQNPYDALQTTVYEKQFSAYTAGISDLDQRIRAEEADVEGLRSSNRELEARLKIGREQEQMYTRMEKAGVATHLDLIQTQDKTLATSNMLTTQVAKLATDEHTLESRREQRKAFVEKWHTDNLKELTTIKDNYDQASNELIKNRRTEEMVNLVAPMDAVVLTIPQLSVGGIANDAEPLFSLMPLNAPIEVDAQIDAQDSGFVKPGDKVTIKFSTFKFLEHGTADGVVRSVSQDAFTENPKQDTVTRTGGNEQHDPYFDTRIQITALHLHDVPPNAHLVPGMTLEANIVVGSRTILWYLMGGALRSGSEAMREP